MHLYWKHPHARGEDIRALIGDGYDGETPPRTWGRPSKKAVPAWTAGNTPTHVGKTGKPLSAF